MYWVKNRLVWVILEQRRYVTKTMKNRGERDKDNETGLREGGGIEILYAYARLSLRF